MPISYAIRPADPGAHLFHVTCRVESPDPQGQRFMLPAWVPGSYMIREMARNVVRIVALGQSGRLGLHKLDKHTWQVEPNAGAIELAYEIYAADLSVRTAYLDDQRGFFTGSSVFMLPVGLESEPCRVDILPPDGKQFRQWRLITGLTPERGTSALGFGPYCARDYAELIDCPAEMGAFAFGVFDAQGVEHRIAVTGVVARLDIARLQRDLERVCSEHVALFDPVNRVAPFDRYFFLVLATEAGYGGLEHRNSSALMCKRDDLPFVGMNDATEGYRTFLGLASHEYLHAWLVKRIRPSAFVPYDLTQENYTRLLWAFEGFTSYYDDLALTRAGLLTEGQYLAGLSKAMTTVMQRSGRLKQSVADSSFDAWIKYYRQDESAPNSIVSYYQKGALIALAIDLAIRAATNGRRSLDDVMRWLWDAYRNDDEYRGIAEDGVADAILQATGVDLRSSLAEWTESTSDPGFAELLAPFGIAITVKPVVDDPKFALLGIRATGSEVLRVSNVFDGSAAQAAGISAHDTLVAFDRVRVSAANVDRLLARYQPGDRIEVTAFRRDELRTFDVHLATQPPLSWQLSIDKKAGRAANERRARWLRSLVNTSK